jgi:hypothetical protein
VNIEVFKYAFGTKFCVLTRDSLNYYTSKENFLKQLRPLYTIRFEDIKEVNKISAQFIYEESNLQIKPPKTANRELYCFYIRTERMDSVPCTEYKSSVSPMKCRETYKSMRVPYKQVRHKCEKNDRSILLDSKVLINLDILVKSAMNVKNFQNLLIFASDNERYINSWVYVLEYLTKHIN